MKIRVFFLSILFAASYDSAFAACTTNNAARQNSHLTQSQINTLLGGRFVCARKSGIDSPGWNEQHNNPPGGSNNLIEQHEGGSTIETVGSWNTSSITTDFTRGRVTYTYLGGLVTVYEVATPGQTVACSGVVTPDAACTAPGTFDFCQISGGGPDLSVTVAASAPTLASCPAN
jgi:hypothetical protein